MPLLTTTSRGNCSKRECTAKDPKKTPDLAVDVHDATNTTIRFNVTVPRSNLKFHMEAFIFNNRPRLTNIEHYIYSVI
ncbi:MAG: hypothetical protein ACTSU9_11170 [Promethearchaeota archaeon]